MVGVERRSGTDVSCEIGLELVGESREWIEGGGDEEIGEKWMFEYMMNHGVVKCELKELMWKFVKLMKKENHLHKIEHHDW